MFAVNLRFFFTIDVYRNVINWKRDASKHVTQEAAWLLSLFWQMAVDFTRLYEDKTVELLSQKHRRNKQKYHCNRKKTLAM